MTTRFITFLILFSLTIPTVSAQRTVYPLEVIPLPHKFKEPAFSDDYLTNAFAIYKLSFQNNDNECINLKYIMALAGGDASHTYLDIRESKDAVYNLTDSTIGSLIETKGPFSPPSIPHDYKGIFTGDGNHLELEGAYATGTLLGPEQDPSSSISHRLEMVQYSPDGKYIGGAIRVEHFSLHAHHYYDHYWLVPAVWEFPSGEKIFPENPQSSDLQISGDLLVTFPLETYFSSDNQFLVIRGIAINYDTFFQPPLKPQPPGTILLELNTLTARPSNKDIAFTSDSRYYVTEIDTFPSLVNTQTGEIQLRFFTGSPMFAAAFSPGDRHLYIAGENGSIYVFNNPFSSGISFWDKY